MKDIPLIEFKNVTILKHPGRMVLRGVSLKIRAGENIAILGPNGAGKSSLIKAITRQHYPAAQEGSSFRIWGEEEWNVFELRSTLGIVSSELQRDCDREISGWETVLSGFFGGIGLYNEPVTAEMEKKAGEVLDFLEITGLKDKNMNEMSSGEARRFLIGRALVHDPKALILDEPASNLDPHSSRKFMDVLSKLASSGAAVILVTQNIQDIIPEITRVVFLKGGRVACDGPKEEVLRSAVMSELFETPLDIETRDGYYYAFPRR